MQYGMKETIMQHYNKFGKVETYMMPNNNEEGIAMLVFSREVDKSI